MLLSKLPKVKDSKRQFFFLFFWICFALLFNNTWKTVCLNLKRLFPYITIEAKRRNLNKRFDSFIRFCQRSINETENVILYTSGSLSQKEEWVIRQSLYYLYPRKVYTKIDKQSLNDSTKIIVYDTNFESQLFDLCYRYDEQTYILCKKKL